MIRGRWRAVEWGGERGEDLNETICEGKTSRIRIPDDYKNIFTVDMQ